MRAPHRTIRSCSIVALLAVVLATASAGAAAAQAPPGGPILVVTNPADAFGGYYGEILRAEGLNEFAVTDVGSLDAAALSRHQVVVLAQTGVTAAQAAALTAWVEAGGNLIAMRPDPRLAGLLGLGADTGDLAEGYIGIDTASAPGAGLTGQTMQYHGTADRWSLAGARAVARLYATASSATPNPAVTLRSVGTAGGEAAAFTYDLARSVVYTRQGNPAWAGEERDGETQAIRSDDLFFPDWVDFAKIRIPQADEQQRLLANLVTRMSSDRMPLPRFWYLPRGEKAAVVMTGDDHASDGTTEQFDMFRAASPGGCSVADWQCVRSTSYLYPNTPISNAAAAADQGAGFELALHLTTGCSDFTPAGLAGNWADQLPEFRTAFPSLAPPRTNRTHCIPWSDWASEPKVARQFGVRLDTNYYYWPGSWVQDRPGLFTGSGFPMRFADADGSVIDSYQAATQLTDELGSNQANPTYIPAHIEALIDGALGPQGYFGVFTANMHTDHANHAGANAIVAEAVSRGVPVVSAAQMLDWLDGRNGSSFQGLSYAGGRLQFGVARAAGARGLEAMVPAQAATGALQGLTRDGAPVAVSSRTVKGVDYAVFDAAPGTYVATYPAPAGTPGAPGPGSPSPSRPLTPQGDVASGHASSDATKPRVTIRRRTLTVSRRGTIKLRVSCPASEVRCLIDLRLYRGSRRLAGATFVVAGGKTATVPLALRRDARRALARARALRVIAAIRARDAAGNRRNSETRLRLQAPARR
jgi:hypothetical protein